MFYYDGYNLAKSEKNAVIVFGGTLDKSIPVAELSKNYNFNFSIFNKSVPELSVKDAKAYFDSYIQPMHPEAMLLHIGERDLNLFKNNSTEFDSLYIQLIEEIKSTNSKCRIALVSLYNDINNSTVAEINRHIKAIADSEKCALEARSIQGSNKICTEHGSYCKKAFTRHCRDSLQLCI